MARRFNVAGPRRPAIDSVLSATGRLPGAVRPIRQQRSFVLHTPARRATSPPR